MFSELNMISIKNIKKISKPQNKDIEDPDVMWLTKKEVKRSLLNDNFKGLTYATAALVWLLNNDER